MGYTHYWLVKDRSKKVEAKYKKAILACQQIAFKYNQVARDWDRLSGYAAHCKPGSYGGLKINGKDSNAHEDFCFREHWNENDDFTFCKTARKPYDLVVTACLATLKYYLGDAIEVCSDGDLHDWENGIKLAELITKRKIGSKFKLKEED